MSDPETRVFEPSGGIPNNRLPVAIYRDALPGAARDGRGACALLSSNGWGGNWLYGVYPFWHFHTRGHEVLACTAGSARLGIGGDAGMETMVRQGDVCVLPAGVGHRCLEATGDFQMAGGYPPGQVGNIVRPGDVDMAGERGDHGTFPACHRSAQRPAGRGRGTMARGPGRAFINRRRNSQREFVQFGTMSFHAHASA